MANVIDKKMVNVRINPGLYSQLINTCKGQDTTVSQVLRAAIRDYVEKHSKPKN